MSLQTQTKEAFLKFVARVDLCEFEEPLVGVAGEVTSTFSNTRIDPAKEVANPIKHNLQ